MLDDGFVFLGGVGELAALPDVVGDGFLDVGVFSVGSCGDTNEGVGVIGGGDDHGIDVLGFTDLAVISELLDLEAFFIELRGKGIEDFRIHVAKADEFGSFAFHDVIGEIFAAAIEADDADAEVAVGAGGAGQRGNEGEGSGEGRGR